MSKIDLKRIRKLERSPTRAYKEGKQAANDEETANKNPYVDGKQKEEWMLGYIQVNKERKSG